MRKPHRSILLVYENSSLHSVAYKAKHTHTHTHAAHKQVASFVLFIFTVKGVESIPLPATCIINTTIFLTKLVQPSTD